MVKYSDIPVVKRSLLSWILPGHLHLQVLASIIIGITVLARIVPLEMQKRVINEAIYLRKVDLLLFYCGIYLIAVISASLLKLLLNYLETLITQRATANMRKALYHHILTLPLSFFRTTQPGSVVNSLVNELTLPGNFVGMATTVPASNILTLLGFAGYLFWLNPILAGVSLSIYPLVLLLLPLLQRKVNQANKKRVDISRKLSSNIAESISGIHEIQAHGAFTIEGCKFDRIVDRLLKVRIIWSLYRFGIKTLNNFFTSLGPFLIFILGGYLSLQGNLELGALVAFLSAQEKLYDPWKELIEFYQVYQDGAVTYRRTMEFFDYETYHELPAPDHSPLDLKGNFDVSNLSFITPDGIRLLDDITLELNSGEHLALVGFSGSGKSTLALCLGRLYHHTHGKILLGGMDMAEMPTADVVSNIGFVSQAPFIFSGTIKENLLYSWKALHYDPALSGQNTEPSLDDMITTLQQAGIFIDVLRFGLNAIISAGAQAELVEAIIRIRHNFQRKHGRNIEDIVEFFNEKEYLNHSSIATNLIFGTIQNSNYDLEELVHHNDFREFLDDADLTIPLLILGSDLAIQTVDILKIMPPSQIFFEQSPIHANEFDLYRSLAQELKRGKNVRNLSELNRKQLLNLALRFTPGLHKMGTLTSTMEKLILIGRTMFRDRMIRSNPDQIQFYQTEDYIYSETILKNILFGTIKSERSDIQERIDQSIITLLIEEDLLEAIVAIGMQFDVGSKGDRLSGGQRQKLAIARVLLKKPRILILDEATSALDNKSQARIQKILDFNYKGKKTVIAVVHRLDIVKEYDQVAVMKAGKIVEMGTYSELIAKRGVLHELEFGSK